MAEQLSGQDGRQGKRGRPALYVLVASVGLMVAALAGLMMWQGASSPPDYASQSQDASRRTFTSLDESAWNYAANYRLRLGGEGPRRVELRAGGLREDRRRLARGRDR